MSLFALTGNLQSGQNYMKNVYVNYRGQHMKLAIHIMTLFQLSYVCYASVEPY